MNRLIRAVIDTHALRHNLRTIRERARGARVMAVVKANAYGHGLIPTALALAEADAFAVARLEEGLALRAAGYKGIEDPKHPFYVGVQWHPEDMGGEESAEKLFGAFIEAARRYATQRHESAVDL